MESKELYVIRQIPRKGIGLVASVAIGKGTRILSEAPIATFPRSAPSLDELGRIVASKVEALDEEDRKKFYSLHNSFGDLVSSSEMGIFRTNVKPFGREADFGGIFPVISRINHACVQNAQHTWNKALQRMTIHAARDIEKDEEITICYWEMCANREIRQCILKNRFQFSCLCQLCSLPISGQENSESTMEEIGSILDERTPLQDMHHLRRLLDLCKEVGIVGTLIPGIYGSAFLVAARNADAARASVFVGRAAASHLVLEGEDSPAVHHARGLAKDPTRYSGYGKETRWSSSVYDVPKNLSAEAFEAWLWRDANAQQYGSLRDDDTFPPFASLTHEQALSLEFWEIRRDNIYQPRKHWCFLAEITKIEQPLGRLKLTVEDKSSQKIPISFYTDRRGMELKRSYVRKGYTVAVLYPEQHGFLDMTVGIRLLGDEVFNIFPIGLNDLLQLSDRIQLYATGKGNERTCQGCQRKSTTLKKCARCSMTSYCDVTCQTLGWKQNGHKRDCKLLAGPSLQLLLRLVEPGRVQTYEF